MFEKTTKVVVDFTVGLYPEALRTKQLWSVIECFATGKKDFETSCRECENIAGTSDPLARLKKIIETCARTASPIVRSPLPGKKTRPWTQTDDNRLLAGILKYGIDNWTQISKFVGNGRTKPQCSQRYSRALNPKISKEMWTADEDKKLLELITKYGDKRWTIISESLGNRTDVQCRYRYKQLLKKKSASSSSSSAAEISYGLHEQGETIFVEKSSPETQSSEASSFDESLCNYQKEAMKEESKCNDEQKKSVFDRQIESIFAFNEVDLFNSTTL